MIDPHGTPFRSTGLMVMVQSYRKTIFWVIYQCRYRE